MTIYNKIVQSTTLPDHPIGRAMTIEQKDDDNEDSVFVIWRPGQGRRGGRICKVRHLKVLGEAPERKL